MVETVLLNGKRFDCGSIQGYVEAIKHVASNYKFDQKFRYKYFIKYIKITLFDFKNLLNLFFLYFKS